MTRDNNPLTGQQGLYATAAIDKNSNEIIIKVVNTSDKAQTNNILLQTSKKIGSEAKLTELKSENLYGMNSIEAPETIKPVNRDITIKGKKIEILVAPFSFTVLRIKLI
jgi:alpha-L-arabinofuranosidase